MCTSSRSLNGVQTPNKAPRSIPQSEFLVPLDPAVHLLFTKCPHPEFAKLHREQHRRYVPGYSGAPWNDYRKDNIIQ